MTSVFTGSLKREIPSFENETELNDFLSAEQLSTPLIYKNKNDLFFRSAEKHKKFVLITKEICSNTEKHKNEICIPELRKFNSTLLHNITQDKHFFAIRLTDDQGRWISTKLSSGNFGSIISGGGKRRKTTKRGKKGKRKTGRKSKSANTL